MRRKGKTPGLILKYVITIDLVMWWFEIIQYNDIKVITIMNLVDTKWLSRCPRPT